MAGRILALDFGMRRIGVAVSDSLGLTAQGLVTIERRSAAIDLPRIQLLAKEYAVERVIVGNPISAKGEETAMSRHVAEFVNKLQRWISCPIELWDERLTSVQANRMLRESGIGIEKRRRAVDRVAATLLLESYLDYRAHQAAVEAEGGAAR